MWVFPFAMDDQSTFDTTTDHYVPSVGYQTREKLALGHLGKGWTNHHFLDHTPGWTNI
jgi:hypothetical protein